MSLKNQKNLKKMLQKYLALNAQLQLLKTLIFLELFKSLKIK